VTTRPLTFLSDYGYEDEFAGVCRGVIAAAAPASSLVDLTHGILRGDIRAGAIVLERSLPFCAPGVHLAVVDPGVGGDRRAVAIRTAAEDRFLVGPDNGLLSPAAARFGGAAEMVDISLSPARLEPVSATFHGRDLFAPVAARIALGDQLADLGETVDPAGLIGIELPEPKISPEGIIAHVIGFDAFGNLSLNVSHEQLVAGPLRLGAPIAVEIRGEVHEAAFARTYAEVPIGALLAYEDSSRTLALAVNSGSAADLLGAGLDEAITLRPR
jgi:S-adenosyl-L-methionine hydrolase (adenosine-forming)